MLMYDIIYKKQQGGRLSPDEIGFVVDGFVRGEIPDYQMSALLMAILFRGMEDGETADLTYAMMNSGDVVDLSRFGDLTVDKHSTGGVGDKTTLLVAPIAAACGARIAKMSGRGLGHTGGTVDKLESIPGYRTEVSMEEFLGQVERIGIHVISQSGDLAPADKKIYALRDVTATVNSLPLIVSSIMSKKLASGARSIVLDVKYGSGAFMKTAADARRLAESMISIGRLCGRRVSAFITDMDTPLGRAVGNSLEVEEAVSLLTSPRDCDLLEVSLALSGRMVSLALGLSSEEGYARARAALDSGRAAEKFFDRIHKTDAHARAVVEGNAYRFVRDEFRLGGHDGLSRRRLGKLVFGSLVVVFILNDGQNGAFHKLLDEGGFSRSDGTHDADINVPPACVRQYRDRAMCLPCFYLSFLAFDVTSVHSMKGKGKIYRTVICQKGK